MKKHQSPVTSHRSRSYNACSCRHCQFWRAKVAEVDAALGLVTGAHKKLKWAHYNSTKRLVDDVDTMTALYKALRDFLGFYDRSINSHGKGWTVPDVERLAEIRRLASPVTDHESPVTGVSK